MKFRSAIAVLFLAVLSCSASTIVYEGQVDGNIEHTGPTYLLIDGVLTNDAACISEFLPLPPTVPPTWTGNVIPLLSYTGDSAVTLEEIAWLYTQFDLYPGLTNEEQIQRAIWNENGATFVDGLPWDALAAANYTSIDPSLFAIVVPDDGKYQPFILDADTSGAPEPVTMSLTGGALIALALIGRKRWNTKRR